MILTKFFEIVPIEINHNGTTSPNTEYLILDSTTLDIDGVAIGTKMVVIESFSITNNHATETLTFELLKNTKTVYSGSIIAGASASFLAPTDLKMLTRTLRDVVGNYYLLTSTNIEFKIKVTSTTTTHVGIIELVISHN